MGLPLQSKSMKTTLEIIAAAQHRTNSVPSLFTVVCFAAQCLKALLLGCSRLPRLHHVGLVHPRLRLPLTPIATVT